MYFLHFLSSLHFQYFSFISYAHCDWSVTILVMCTLAYSLRAAMPSPLPRNVRNRYTVKNGISNLYILLKSALKMQEMPFQRPTFQNIFPRTLELCRHHGLPLTKVLATPLDVNCRNYIGYSGYCHEYQYSYAFAFLFQSKLCLIVQSIPLYELCLLSMQEAIKVRGTP